MIPSKPYELVALVQHWLLDPTIASMALGLAFAAGIILGYSVRAYISRRRRHWCRF